jgi:hypothetical protein
MNTLLILFTLAVSSLTPLSGFQRPIRLSSLPCDSTSNRLPRPAQGNILQRSWCKTNNRILESNRCYSSGKATATSLFGIHQTSINAIKTFVTKRFRFVSQKIITKWRHHRPFSLGVPKTSSHLLEEECTIDTTSASNSMITLSPLIQIVTQKIIKKLSQHKSLYPPWVSNVSFLQNLLLLEEEVGVNIDYRSNYESTKITLVQDQNFEYASRQEDVSGTFTDSRHLFTEHTKSFGSHLQGRTILNNQTVLFVDQGTHHHHSIHLAQDCTTMILPPPEVLQHNVLSSFMRVTDLDLEKSYSSLPPVGVKPNSREHWVQLASGSNDVHQILTALENAGLGAINDERLWEAEKLTEKHLERSKSNHLDQDSLILQDSLVLLWNGKFYDSNLDCEIPAIRSSGIIAMDAAELTNLLLNSSQTQQYNKFCLGRTDEIVYFDDFDINSVTKVVRTKTKHPLIPKPMEFVTLIHARKLKPEDNHGEGFLIVSRAVTLPNERVDPAAPGILLNVNLIKTITGVEGKCQLINMNHVNSPMTPTFLVKKLGSDGAISFFSELRALCR